MESEDRKLELYFFISIGATIGTSLYVFYEVMFGRIAFGIALGLIAFGVLTACFARHFSLEMDGGDEDVRDAVDVPN